MLLHVALHVGIYSIYFFFPLDLIEYNIIFAVLSRVCAAGSYYACLQFASEIFPTEIRGKGSSAFEISGGIGLFIQPQINYLVSILQKTYSLTKNKITQGATEKLLLISADTDMNRYTNFHIGKGR